MPRFFNYMHSSYHKHINSRDKTPSKAFCFIIDYSPYYFFKFCVKDPKQIHNNKKHLQKSKSIWLDREKSIKLSVLCIKILPYDLYSWNKVFLIFQFSNKIYFCFYENLNLLYNFPDFPPISAKQSGKCFQKHL